MADIETGVYKGVVGYKERADIVYPRNDVIIHIVGKSPFKQMHIYDPSNEKLHMDVANDASKLTAVGVYDYINILDKIF